MYQEQKRCDQLRDQLEKQRKWSQDEIDLCERLGEELVNNIDTTMADYTKTGMICGGSPALLTGLGIATVATYGACKNYRQLSRREFFDKLMQGGAAGFLTTMLSSIPAVTLGHWISQEYGVHKLEQKLTKQYPDKADDISRYLNRHRPHT